MKNVSRRQFVGLMSTAAAGTAVSRLGLLNARLARAAGNCSFSSFAVDGFGPLAPTVPLNSASLFDVPGKGDLTGVPLLRLPPGFRYTAISHTGEIMSDGVKVPGDHDGMACFHGQAGTHILVRNHEQSPGENEYGVQTNCVPPNGKVYDPFNLPAGQGGGGTTTVVVDRDGQVVEQFVSLGGTIRNCAGGPTPWNSWISCEENTSTPLNDGAVTKKHGYNFEVPSQLGEAVDPVPLVAMGRMNHEAISVDPQNGYAYETEDRDDSAYYRFVPNKLPNGFGDYQLGGSLYAMVVVPGQRSDCTNDLLPTSFFQGTEVVDTRGLARGAPGSVLPFLGQPLAVRWVLLEDVDPEEDTLRFEAQQKGGAVWHRGEGAWYHQGKHYWVCTGGGDAGEGQVWCYDPTTETVTLVVESTDQNLLDGPDNITVARDGTIYLCEDGSAGSPGDAFYSQYVVGVDANGGLFKFAHNIIPDDENEFAGACFSPDGRYMFVNNQGIGVTFCIWREDQRPIYLNGGFAG